MVDERYLQAVQGKNFSGRPPVWLMRQAGRFMPQYQELRKRHGLMELFYTPELAAEVTLLPIKYLTADAAILFCDILVIPEAMGCGLSFVEKVGPVIERPVRNRKAIEALPIPSIEESFDFVRKTIQILRKELTVPLIGFSGAPFTVSSYLIEGGSNRNLPYTRKWAYNDPESLHLLLQRVTDITIPYLKLQVEAGAQSIQLFESWANLITPEQFKTFSLPYLKQIIEALRPLKIPITYFGLGTLPHLNSLVGLNPDVISCDSQCDLFGIRRTIPSHIGLQGNFDPFLLYAPKETIKKEVNILLEKMGNDPHFIINLGHGILPDIPMENVRHFIDCVKEFNHAPSLC